MRLKPSNVVLWSVAAVAVAASGGAAYAATGTGSVEVLSPGQVDAALEDTATGESAGTQTPEDEGAEPPGVSGDIEQRTKTTEAGTVTVACSGDIIAMNSVTPAPGWDFTGPDGDRHEAEVVFTTDEPAAGNDALVLTFRCEAGKAVWETGYK